ncbi:MAG: ABC transporter substrate-binding protein [Devosia sp.]|uniref:ABC transporter substrate-binding protein n=1 Tax=Devosia sp. TaxID=1871048 RepID=UPI0024C680FA|nr:ABC transporter substrate-binding protein [Devosia sp.]UYN99415.1 MAG: ABC transporter substrate-binding protein [Devosia sp.]
MTDFYSLSRLGFAALALMVAPAAAAEPQFDAAGCAVDYAPGVDYFADKAAVEQAGNFSVAYFENYKIVTVADADMGGTAETVVLVQCGTPAPDLGPDYADVPRVTIPVRSLFAGSTSLNPALVAVDGVAALTGVAQRDYLATPQIVARAADEGVVEYAPAGITNVEAVVAARPDVVMVAQAGEAEMQRVAQTSIAVVTYADWLESSPLGRAEWVKFLSLFFNAEAKANQAFAEVADNYATALALTEGIGADERPQVLSGQAFGGIFYAAGGRSFMAELIRDAGGAYVFDDNASTGSFQIHDLEQLVVPARQAAFWVQASMQYQTLADIAADDPRLAALPAAKAGQVWMPDALKGPNGGVQFYELGNMRPDLVLMDLISIVHPQLVPDHQRVFYRSIARD